MNAFNLPWRYLEMNPRLVEDNLCWGIFRTENELATSIVERMNACEGDDVAAATMFETIKQELAAESQTEILAHFADLGDGLSISELIEVNYTGNIGKRATSEEAIAALAEYDKGENPAPGPRLQGLIDEALSRDDEPLS